MMYKAAVVLFIILTVLHMSGCIAIPVPTGSSEYGATPSKIKKGMTRNDIVERFGAPVAQTTDGRFLLYVYTGSSGVQVLGAGLVGNYAVAGTGRLDSSYSGRLLLEFDSTDRVKGENEYLCGAHDLRCGTDPAGSLLAMLQENYDAPVVRKYQQSVTTSFALCDAASKGELGTVETLLTEGLNVNNLCRFRVPSRTGPDQESGTALHAAIFNTKPEIVQVLLAHGASVNAKDQDGRTALYAAVVQGDSDLVQLIFARGANVNAKDKDGHTALYAAAVHGDSDLVRLMLAHGAEVNMNAKRQRGPTVLHEAISRSNIEVVRLLLDYGAEVNVKDEFYRTPLHQAAFVGNSAMVKALLGSGARTGATDKDGDTPLHDAASQGHLSVVEALLIGGAAVDVVDNRGKTPIDLATDPRVIKLLKQHASKK